MKHLLKILALFIAFTAQAQVTNFDKLRIKKLEEKTENTLVLVVDELGNVNFKKQSDIEPELDDYYTISEVNTLLEAYYKGDVIDAKFLQYYTKEQVDSLIEGYYTKAETNALLANKQNKLTAGENVSINGNTISATDTKYAKGTKVDIETGSNLEDKVWTAKVLADYINSSAWGNQWLSGSMELATVNKAGSIIGRVDLSSLASGDLQVTIDDTDPNNPILIFKQGGVEVGRVPASSLLSGVARDAVLNGYLLQFKDHSGTVVYDVSFADLFNQKADKSVTITGTGGLTGGGTLAANRTISLSAATSANINKGVQAHDWGDFREYGLGVSVPVLSLVDNLIPPNTPSGFYASGTSSGRLLFPRYITINRSGKNYGLLFSNSGSDVGVQTSEETIYNLWHDGNHRSNAQNDALYATITQLNTKENSFAKNTAFNKNFGVSGGTVSEGNHTHTFASLTEKPTTIAGYGITDAFKPSGTTSQYIRGDGSYATFVNTAYATGTTALLNTGTSTTLSVYAPKSIADYVKGLGYATTTQLNTKANSSVVINATGGLQGGGSLDKNMTISLSAMHQTTLMNAAVVTYENTFQEKNIFEKPIVVPMAVNQNEAINLAQLTASNPIALNRVIVPKIQSIPIGNSYTLSNIDGNLDFVNLSEELFPYNGASVRVTTTLTDNNFITNGKDYKRLILTSVALGIDNAAPNFSRIQTATGAFSTSVKLEIILTRTATGVLSADTNIYESLTNKDTGVQIFTGFQVNSSVMNVTSNNYRIDLGYAQQEFLLSVRSSPVVIERIK